MAGLKPASPAGVGKYHAATRYQCACDAGVEIPNRSASTWLMVGL